MSTGSSTDSSIGFDPAVLIQTHQSGVWRYLRVLGCDRALADDLTQETFLNVLQVPFRDYSAAATAAYLRRTAHNLFVTAMRRAKQVTAVEHLEELDRDWTNWARSDNGESLLESLKECLQHLGERARWALEMRFQRRMPRAQIAEGLKMTEHGAKNLMQRAKQQLRECIRGKM
ncbi:MAG: sigma-70 family RNA polymerase sigma factor [Planctomycetes bacterium]|nr:sigma-70 family RNA polymerase sigma factor [Planctomycetota bacterium]